MRKTLSLASIVLMICVSEGAFSETWYVDGSVSASGDGTSAETALRTIQEGIGKATDSDTVIVAQETYLENIQFGGKNITLTSTDPLDPDVVAETIIDGNLSGSVVTFSGTEDESCVLSGFTITNGQAAVGGGICGGAAGSSTQATIRRNVIVQNSVTDTGGGLAYCYGRIEYNTIAGNSANFGGGLYDCGGTVRNNLIAGNSAGSGGGLYDCGGTIESNTISGNAARVFGGGLRLCRGTIQNCVIWGNTAFSDAQLSGSKEPTYSCVHGWAGPGEGNTAEDPLFVDADGPDDDLETYEDNDYRLAPGSPCIDTGKNEDWMSEALDLDGESRIRYAISSLTVDMGAYEYFPSRIIDVRKVGATGVQIVWTSNPGWNYAIWSCVDLVAGEWTEEETIPGEGATTSWTDTRALGRTKFYRLEMR